MGRGNFYFKEKTERKILDYVQIEIQKGETHGVVNFSSVVEELVNFGFIVKEHQSETKKFDRAGFNRDLIRKLQEPEMALPS